MDKLTKEELANIQGLVSEFNQVKMQLGDTVISQTNILKKVDELRVSYAEAEQELVKIYGKDAVINIETGEVTEPTEEIKE
jgi:hypothetical protein|tara:strand:- start:874 stop:1116 length:243 start_codon:yes stop_codon:yes gene_type:complete